MSYLRFTWIYAGDGIHISAELLLVGWLLQNETCKGISGRTQIVIAMVNVLRLAYVAGGNIYFIDSTIEYALAINMMVTTVSLSTVYLMLVKYKKTVEKDYDTFWIEVLIIISVCIALAYNTNREDPLDVLFYTSRYLESVAILPQIYFVFRTGSKKLCVSLYVFLSFLYTFFYTYYALGTDMTHWAAYKMATFFFWPSFVQMGFYVCYFILLVLVPKYKVEIPLTDVESYTGSSDSDKIDDCDRTPQPIPVIILTRPQLDRQQSLLETPFLKKCPTTTSLSSYTDEASRVKKLNSLLLKRKHGKDDTVSFRTVLTLPSMPKTRSWDDFSKTTRTIFSTGSPSGESTPEDEGITFTVRETARQSRQRRVAYIRQTSLPETSSSSPEASSKWRKASKPDDSDATLNNNLYLPGDEQIMFQRTKTSHEPVVESLENVEQSTEKTSDNNGRDTKKDNDNKLGDVQEVNIAGIIETKKYEQSRFFKSRNIDHSDRSTDPIRKVSSENKTRKKRVSAHQSPLSSQHNWKTIACNFIGTSPLYGRRAFNDIGEMDGGLDSGEEFSSRDSTLMNRRASRSKKSSNEKAGNGKLKGRRATVHHAGTSHHKNWKTVASAFMGMSSPDRRPSIPEVFSRSLSDTNQNVSHKRRKTFWNI